jgi:type II secretory pathway pseudopilin PulG
MCTMVMAALSAAGSVMQGMAASSAAKAQARAEEQNARLAELQGQDAVRRGGREEAKFRREQSILEGRQRSLLAASGVDIDSGSAADLQEASRMEGEEDAAVIRLNAQREKWGFDTQALNHRNAASAARAAGRGALTAGILGAGTSLLSAANSAGGFGKPGAGAANIHPWDWNYAEMRGRSMSGWERGYRKM